MNPTVACHAGAGIKFSKAVDPVQLFFRSRLFSFINQYKNDTPANLLALSNGKWKVPIEKIDEFLDIYLAEYETVPFGLVFLKSPVFPYPMDLDHLEDAGSVGPPLVVVKTVLDTLADVLGEKSDLVEHVHFEQRLERRFHAYFYKIIIDEKKAVRLYHAHVAALDTKFPGIGWGDIVDKCVVTSNGIRLLGSYKYPEARDDNGRIIKGVSKAGKPYSVRRLDRAGGFYRPCTIDFEALKIETLPITKEAILERSLFKPELTIEDITDIPAEDVGPQQVGSSNPSVYDSASEYQGNDNDDEDIVIRLLSLLNVSRFDNYCEWRDIATSLKNEHGDKYRDAWLKYSRTSPKFELGTALELWDRVAKPDYTGPRLTMRSIHRMAQFDSPHSYAQVVATMIDPKIEECITHGGAGHRLAQIFVLLHGEVFVCTNSTARTIHHFKDHRWTESGIGAINLLLSDTVYTAFVDKAASIGRSLANSTGDQNATQKKRYEICNKIALRLLDPRFKSSLLTEICHMLEDRKFFEKLDTKAHLVGFDNGVFDLDDESFRPGQPEDFVSFSCGYNYAYEDDETIQTEIMSFIDSCFDDHDTCLYVLSAYAACIYGYRKFEEFYIQTGEPHSTASTSLMLELCNLMLAFPADYSANRLRCNMPEVCF